MEKKLIMIVDDDEEDIELFKEVLESLDPNVTCIKAVHGMDALRQLYENEFYPDLIFLDLNMPRMDGMGCLAEIKKSIRLKHIPVIIYSTSNDPSDVEETRRLGAAYFLTKPTKYAALCEALSTILFSKPIAVSASHKTLIAFDT